MNCEFVERLTFQGHEYTNTQEWFAQVFMYIRDKLFYDKGRHSTVEAIRFLAKELGVSTYTVRSWWYADKVKRPRGKQNPFPRSRIKQMVEYIKDFDSRFSVNQ